MSWTQQVFNYCERGLDGSLWAEPLNAVTNGAFLVAAVLAGRKLTNLPPATRSDRAGRIWLWALAVLIGAIGIGSALFHTFATRWALLADVVPIMIFMLAYLGFALRAFLGVGWLAIGLILPAFLVSGSLAGRIRCQAETATGVAATPGATEPCLNGSLGYAPALLALLIIGALAWRRGPVGRTLIAAAAVFLVSLTFRTLDQEICAATVALGHPRGTHALWHMLNAVTLYLLMSAAIDHHQRTRAG